MRIVGGYSALIFLDAECSLVFLLGLLQILSVFSGNYVTLKSL